MPPYVLRRKEDDKYVAPAGRHSSYTRFLDQAQIYPTLEDAQRAKCDNEYTVDSALLKPALPKARPR
jgi:hypothetical protein